MNLLNEKLTLLREMLAVSHRQTGLLTADEETDTAEPLAFTIDQRESLMAAIDAVDAKLRGAAPDGGHGASDADGMKTEIRAVLSEIMETDGKNRRLLEEALQKTGGDITRLRGVRKQITAYGNDGPIESGQRFDSTQ
jgi:hypothetical protein